ncbi:hypothetical protein MD588_07870 [Photobacterium sp. SDRW27]|uniref:hypothetical protein n=1 Tax=Photobacterium obscurum TaxID=2829490 RepID=UPI002242DDF0|nr:hypothetical protein [Photobacterium obscurum]MCW8328724.1 hypothetical protein [Photobacterium obscurum]
MAVFNEKMLLRGKAEEDLYFAELDRKLIEALHEKQAKEREQEEGARSLGSSSFSDNSDAQK